MEGLEIFKIYLKYFGYSFYKNSNKNIGKNYGEYLGKKWTSDEERHDLLKTEKNPGNINGNLIKIILISSAAAEGLSLSNIRQIHILEPHWNESRTIQIIGRGIRFCSHAMLVKNERNVEVYRYKVVYDKTLITTDQYIENVAKEKEKKIQLYYDAMKSVAVDCDLNRGYNMTLSEYKCFQFNEPSLFEKHIGPAYKEDLNDDMEYNNGLNSTNSVIERIKVVKINAVILLDKSKNKYSSSSLYWYYPKSGIVYDYDLHFPIGKISIDKNNNPVKLDVNTYIIDYVIPIPTIDL